MNKFVHIMVLLAIVTVNINPLSAQSRNKKYPKPVTRDVILNMAYDDTTAALAVLFLVNRGTNKIHLQRIFTSLAIFSSISITGGLMLSHEIPSLEISGRELPLFTGLAGLVALSGGAGGVVTYTFYATIFYFLKIRPYSLMKFKKLISKRQRGIPLPAYYSRMLATFIERIPSH